MLPSFILLQLQIMVGFEVVLYKISISVPWCLSGGVLSVYTMSKHLPWTHESIFLHPFMSFIFVSLCCCILCACA